jgi:hypothetical protein
MPVPEKPAPAPAAKPVAPTGGSNGGVGVIAPGKPLTNTAPKAPTAGATSGKGGAVKAPVSAKGTSTGSKTGTTAQVSKTPAPTKVTAPIKPPTATEPANQVTAPIVSVTDMQGGAGSGTPTTGGGVGASDNPSVPADVGYGDGGPFLAGEQTQAALNQASVAAAPAAAPTAGGKISGFLTSTTGKIVVFGAVGAGGLFLYRRMNKGGSMKMGAK